MRRLAAHGLSVGLPPGWDARIERRAAAFPVLHASTQRLPAVRGDYGSGLVETMGGRDVFVALVEFDPRDGGAAMFDTAGIPLLREQDFDPNAQQRVIPGMCGSQRFLVASGRAFCLYVVLGSWVLRRTLVATANEVVGTIQVG
jgi:hypothetical protein